MGFHRIPSLRLVKIGWVLFNRALWARCASRKNAANRCLRQRRNLRGNGLHPSRSNARVVPPPFGSVGGRASRVRGCFFAVVMGFRRGCQTGIIRTRFGAADFRLNRVIRLANTSGY